MPTLTALERRLERTILRAEHYAARRHRTAQFSATELAELVGIVPDPWQRDVLTSTAQRILMLCSRQSGKSQTAATLAMATALNEASALVLLLSPGLRQSSELFRKTAAVYAAAGCPVPTVSQNALSLTLTNGSRIVSLPGTAGTVRGFSDVRLLIVDEAAFVPNDLYLAVRPMLAVSGGRLVALSTPYGARGWFYEAWNGAEPWERYRVTALDCPRIAPDFLAEEQRTLGDYWYRQEYLCEFMDAHTRAFTEAEINAAFDESIEQWDDVLEALPGR